MAAPLGHPRYGGRAKGAKNKDKSRLIDKAQELGVDPFEILLLFAKGDWASLGYEHRQDIVGYSKNGSAIYRDVIDAKMRLTAAAEAVQYLEPKRKAVEVTGVPESPITIEIKERAKILSADPAALLLAKQLEDKLNADDAILAGEPGTDGATADPGPL